MNLRWLDFDGVTYWATTRWADGGGLHLLVEKAPGDTWDWTVWTDMDREHNRSGITADAEAAILAAKTAAEELSRHWTN
jgi:hypothetical protein